MRVYTVKFKESSRLYVVIAENIMDALNKAEKLHEKWTVFSIKIEFQDCQVLT